VAVANTALVGIALRYPSRRSTKAEFFDPNATQAHAACSILSMSSCWEGECDHALTIYNEL
jgi:hypothetical protein